jgi:hypothetical protein
MEMVTQLNPAAAHMSAGPALCAVLADAQLPEHELSGLLTPTKEEAASGQHPIPWGSRAVRGRPLNAAPGLVSVYAITDVPQVNWPAAVRQGVRGGSAGSNKVLASAFSKACPGIGCATAVRLVLCIALHAVTFCVLCTCPALLAAGCIRRQHVHF